MAKRFTDTEKWKKKFFRELQAPYKLVWIYILDECNYAGVWNVEFDVLKLRTGISCNAEEILKIFSEKIISFDNNEKWFIEDFISFQYGTLNSTNRVHNSIISLLVSYKNKGLRHPLQGAKDKDMDKDEGEDKDKELIPENFTNFHNTISLFNKKNYNEKKWLECYDKLIRIDGYSEDRILSIVKEFRTDGNWWHDNGNFESLIKLRHKNKEGVKFIDVFDKQINSANKGMMNAGPDYDGGF